MYLVPQMNWMFSGKVYIMLFAGLQQACSLHSITRSVVTDALLLSNTFVAFRVNNYVS